LIEALRGVDASGAAGRADIESGLADHVDRGLLPNDLAITIRATLDIGKPSPGKDDALDPPTEPRRAARSLSGPSHEAPLPPAPEPLRAAGPSAWPTSPAPADPLREKVDEVVLSALTSDFHRYRRNEAGAPASGERSSDRQLDAALASFRGARLRRDATKSSEGSARAFDFAALSKSGADSAVAVGAILKNRFVLDREIGRGGMGVVYRAVDRRRLEAMHNQPYVAVKLLTGDVRRSPDALRALEAEARRAQELAHPNIVNTYDFDRDGAQIFIVMELLEGRPLDAVLRESPDGLGFEASRKIVEGICAGLAYAHGRGVAHCDLKPANVFVEAGGGVKLLDFGIATAGWAGGFDLASLNAYTLAYASPEMLQGEPRDPRDDTYALGCLIYVVLTGRHPFERASALEARDRELTPKRPPRIPGPAWAALRGALAFDRAKRIKSAGAFQREYFKRSWRERLFGRG
jgi:predicted Ser/Thr protein kinase